MRDTKIEWADCTFNPWTGCTKVSPGCDHCYAETQMDTRLHVVKWGAGQPRKRTSPTNWRGPVRWNAECEKAGTRARVFCASLADWLDNEVDAGWLADLLDLIRNTPNLDWLLLSKRIGNWRVRLEAAFERARADGRVELAAWIRAWMMGAPPANVWLGITVINQEEADRDVPKLLVVPAAKRFLSIEPMLGPIDLTCIQRAPGAVIDALAGTSTRWRGSMVAPRLDWVICGGESGPHARPMHPDWARSLRDQCQAADVPFFLKQLGGHPNKRGNVEDLPDDLRIRELPHDR